MAESRFVPSQWEMLLQSKTISHWLGRNLESALYVIFIHPFLSNILNLSTKSFNFIILSYEQFLREKNTKDWRSYW